VKDLIGDQGVDVTFIKVDEQEVDIATLPKWSELL